MVVLIKILQVVLALSVLILIHEFGHFIFAKMFRIRVEKFYLFFDAGFALFRFKPKNSETEYGIGWLPLGGYCKISGMVDESMDMDSLKSEPKPWEFRSKPAWQRLLVMSGGVLFNFIFAIIVYIGILAGWGESYISNEDNSIYVNELAYDMGFRNGDRILKFDDYTPERFEMLQADLARQTARKATVLRGDDTIDIYIDQKMIGDVLKSPGMFDLADYVGQATDITVVRDNDTLQMPVQVDTNGLLGVYASIPGLKTKTYSVLSAVPAGIKHTFTTIGGYIQDLKLVFTPSTEAYKSVGSFIAMGQIFPATWDWYRFLNILALLSIMLGVMNLIPIPALDGGHILFTLYEMITGKKPSDKFLTAAQMVGMVLLLALMVLAFGNDIGRLIR